MSSLRQEELRVGNWLFYEATVDDNALVQINGSDIATFDIMKERYFPIPLTEEWLVKFGFAINMDNFNWNAGIGNTDHDFDLALRYTDTMGWFYRSRKTPIKSVHQLQNLYYAITSKELLLK